jgi:hypothetical protein
MTLTVGAIPERYHEIALKNLNWIFILLWQEVSERRFGHYRHGNDEMV